MLNNTDIKVPEELECVWTGKNKTTLPIYTPVAEKTKGSFVGSIYEKTSPTSKNPRKQNSRWLGKLGMANANLYSTNTLSISKMRRGTNRDAVKEKIASDFYYLLACASDLAFDVPKARLADLPILNPYTEKNELAKFVLDEINRTSGSVQPITNAIHIMSKWVDDYQDLAEAQVCNTQGMIVPYLTHLKETGCLSDTIFVKEKNIPLTGLLELLAAARLLGDVDVLGNGGSNTGFIIQKDLRGTPIFAKIVKIDPGFVFTVNEQESLLFATLYPPSNPIMRRQLRTLKDIKDIQIGTTTEIVVSWSSLTNDQKSRFLKTLQKGIKLLKQREIVIYLFSRDEKFNAYGDHPLMTKEIMENYLLNLELLLEMQEPAYGDLFNEVILDDNQLQIKENELNTKNFTITSLELKIVELRKTIQELKDSELSLKMQTKEYQKQQHFFAQNTKQSLIYNNANNNSPKTTSELNTINDSRSLQTSQDEITKDLATLLKLVTEGHLIEVGKLLGKNPNLALMAGTVTDLSDRTFNNITVFQYALWALDIEMCNVILKYLDKASALSQLNSLEMNPTQYSQHGAHYDITPLITKTQQYFSSYSNLSSEKRDRFWKNEVGGAQRQCPAWLIYAWREKGDNVDNLAWVKKDLKNIKVTRQYENDYLNWWFSKGYDFKGEGVLHGKGVGTSWAMIRGDREFPLVQSSAPTNPQADLFHAKHDHSVCQSVGPIRSEALKSLKTDLENSIIRNNSSVAFKSGSVINTTALAQQLITPQVTNSQLTIINNQEQKEKMQQGLNQNSIFTYKQDSSINTNTNIINLNNPKLLIPKDELTKKDLGALLKWVTEGHLIEVEKLLKKNPELTLMTKTVTDLSDRIFNNITVFQYAAWALDIGMWNLILKYLDSSSALMQLQSLEAAPEKYSQYGAHYDITPLVTKTREYLDNYCKWNYNKCEQHWQKEVGGAQRQCPAWLIYAWCEKGSDAAWVKKDLASIQFTRQYEEDHLKWWFTGVYNEGKGVGSTWAVARGEDDRRHSWAGRSGYTFVGGKCVAYTHRDLEVSQSVGRVCHEAVKSLKTDLENSIINHNNSKGFKYG